MIPRAWRAARRVARVVCWMGPIGMGRGRVGRVAWVARVWVERSCWGESVSGLVGRCMNVLFSMEWEREYQVASEGKGEEGDSTNLG